MKYLLLLISLTIFSCQQKIPENFDSINLRFQDSSVPPEYHRSYKIILKKNRAVFRVNSYSTPLVDTSIDISSDAFLNLKKQLNSIEELGEFNTCDDCDGSSRTSFRLLNGKTSVFSLEWTSAKPSEHFQAILDQIKYTVPNFDQLIDTPLPK